MRILITSDYADPLAKVGAKRFGGISVYIANLAKYLSEKDIEIDVFTPWHTSKGGRIINLNNNLRFIRILTGPTKKFENEIYDFIKHKKIKYDLIHSNYWFAGMAGINLSQKLKTPQVHVYHSHGKIREEALRQYNLEKDLILEKRIETEKIIATSVKNIIATSSSEKKILQKLYGIKSLNIHTIPIGVDTKIFKPIEKNKARKLIKIRGKGPFIIFVGRVEDNKGLTTLIETFHQIIRTHKNARLIVVGGEKNQFKKGHEIYNLKMEAKKLRILKNVSFTGTVSQSRLALYYSAADVCIAPSLYETFGIVPIESMACGTPIVASNTGGLKCTVKNNKTGYLAKVGDSKDFSRKIFLVLKNGKESYQKNCLYRVHKYFSWQKISQEYLETYKQILHHQRAKAKSAFIRNNSFRQAAEATGSAFASFRFAKSEL